MQPVLNLLRMVSLSVALAAWCSAGVQAQESKAGTSSNGWSWRGPKLRLAIMDLNGSGLKNPPNTNSSGTVAITPPTEFARGLTEMLTTALVKTNRFVVLERVAMEKLAAEGDLGAGARGNAETAPKAGRVIGAQAIITGDITEFSYSRSEYGASLAGLHGLGSKLGKHAVTARVTIDLRIVDAATGQVIAAQRADGKASMSNVSADVTRRGQALTAELAEDTPLGQASRQALEKAVNAIIAGMRAVPWSARVIDVRDGVVYINAGGPAGIDLGMELDVYHPGEALVDPETGQSLGAPESRIGSVTVDSVQESYSSARVISGTGMQRGDVVRLRAAGGERR